MTQAATKSDRTTVFDQKTVFDQMTVFDRTTALEAVGPGRFAARFDASWTSLGGVLGGYLTAHVVRAVTAVDPHRPVRTVTVAFLRPGLPGDAVVSVQPVRTGRTVTVHDVLVEQDGRPVLRARVTTTAPDPDALTWSTDALALPPPVERCEPIAPPEEARHFDHAVAVLDPDWRPFSGRPRARVAGWVRPREPRPIDAPWLAMVLDWFPPAAFTRTQPPTGGVSVDYTVHLHRTVPALGDRWLAAMFRADTAAGGLALEHGVITDAAGVPLAESFHTRVA